MALSLLKLQWKLTDAGVARAARSLDRHTRTREKIARQISALCSEPTPAPEEVADAEYTVEHKPSEAVSAKGRGAAARADGKGLKPVPATVIARPRPLAEPDVELIAEIDDAMRAALSPEYVEQVLREAKAPKQTVEVEAEALPELESTVTLAKLTLLRSEDSVLEREPLGTLISAMVLHGCMEASCGTCTLDGDGAPSVSLQFVPAGERKIRTIEVSPETRVLLEL